MAKQKERSEVEFLRSENKNLKSQVKHLQKEISRLSKRHNRAEDLEKELSEHYLKEEVQNKEIIEKVCCSNCNKGELNLLDLGIRKYTVCSNCGKRSILKK